MRNIKAGYNMSPRLLHSLLLPYNFRRNLRMQIKHRGLPAEYAGFYAQHIVEDLQELTAGWFETPLYPEWVSVNNFKDTGERTGLVASVPSPPLEQAMHTTQAQLPFERIALMPGAGDSDDSEVEAGDALAALPATASVKFYARMQALPADNVLPFTRVITAAEKEKFKREWARHTRLHVS
jgi:hypothetical protein